jgi:hypothetical protein
MLKRPSQPIAYPEKRCRRARQFPGIPAYPRDPLHHRLGRVAVHGRKF